MRPTHPTLPALAVVLGLAVGACAGSGEPEPLGGPVAAPSPDPCALLDAEQIRDVTGWEVRPGEQGEDPTTPDVAVCHFVEGDHLGTVQVVVAEQPGGGPADAARVAFEADRDDVVDVSVAGASEAWEARAVGVVGMVVDGRFVEVAAVGAGLDDRDHLRLAELVAERV